MDIMAGTGTLMIGALVGRRVILVEISEKFSNLQWVALDSLESIAPGIQSQVTIINLPCQQALPIPCDHIIFSPPYANIMRSKGTDRLTMEKTTYDMAEYQETSQHNVGSVNEWLYHQKMEPVYSKCFESIKPGGTLTIIIKDHMEKRERVALSSRAAQDCQRIGFELDSWHKWLAQGSVYTDIYRARGWEVVDDEDVIILRRPV